jgi:hypothetical protein
VEVLAMDAVLRMLVVIGIGLIGIAASQTISTSVATSTIPTTTTQSGDEVCASSNSSCEACVKHASCFWCESDSGNKCILYPPGEVLPTSVCSLSNARWGVCWVNYQILLIVMCVLAFVIIVTIITCVYCCCCKIKRRYNTRREERETEQENRDRVEREARNAERRAERQAKYDDIRRKYGLKKDEANVQYNRFENEVC